MDEFVTALAVKNDISKELLAELARDYCLSGYHDGQIKAELEDFVKERFRKIR